jgi:nitrate reductase beta subunit
VQAAVENGAVERTDIIPDVESLRIPVRYLANLLTGGKEEPVVLALKRMLAMRSFMRRKNLDGLLDDAVLEKVGMDRRMVQEMYRYMAIADYEDRFVIPTSHREQVENAYELHGGCGFSFGSGCAPGGLTEGAPARKSRGDTTIIPTAILMRDSPFRRRGA